MYFSVSEPEGVETPVVVEVPHAGLLVDAPALSTMIAPPDALRRDADLYVDQLFSDAPAEGASLLVSHVSRYLCDLNRSEDDLDTQAVEGACERDSPHGLVWVRTSDQRPVLARPLPRAELERRLETIYRPYHQTLSALLERKRACFGWSVLLSAHSMPGPSGGEPCRRARADIVPGSRGRSTAAASVIDALAELALDYGWSVSHDDPYRGGHTVARHGRPGEARHAIQLEIARRLYMDERTLSPKVADFARVRAYCRALVARLGSLPLG